MFTSNECTSNFEDGMQNFDSTNKSSAIQYPNEPSEGIRACILGRERILKLFTTPDFAKIVVDCFVRFVDQNNRVNKIFKIARVVSVLDDIDHGCYSENRGALLQLDDKSEVALDIISEEPAEETEIQQWLMSMIKKNKSTPTINELINKITEISSALSWPFSPGEKQMEEVDNFYSNETENWQYWNSEFEITDNVEQIVTDVIESVENEDGIQSNNQMEQEVAENMVIDGTTGTQLLPEDENIEMGLNYMNVPSEFQMSDACVIDQQTDTCTNQLTTYEELLEIFLQRSQIIRIFNQPTFSKTIIGSFVRFLYNLPSSPRTDPSLLKDNLRYKIMQIVGVHKCEVPYSLGRISVDKELKLECDRVIVHGKISSVSDSIPTQNEFDSWKSAIANKHSESTMPSIDFLKSKALAIKNAINAEKEENNVPPSTNGSSLEMSTSIISKSQTRSQNNISNKSIITTTSKSKVSTSTTSTTFIPPRISISSPAIITNNPTTSNNSSTQRPKGFEIFKSLKNCLNEEQTVKTTFKKEQPIPIRTFYSQLTKKDKEVLLKNGFKKKVNIRISKKEFDKFLFNYFEVTNNSKLSTNNVSQKRRNKSHTPSIDNNFENLQNKSVIGACAHINVGDPISIKNVEDTKQNINSLESQQSQQNSNLSAQINQVKLEVIEIDEITEKK